MRKPMSFARWLLGYEGIPYMSRPTIRWELLSTFFLTMGASVVVPQFTTLFVKLSLFSDLSKQQQQAWDYALPLLVTEIAAGNLLASFLARYFQSWRRVPLIVWSRLLIAAAMLGIAFLPVSSHSIVPFALLLCLPAFAMGINLNVRASVLHSNFPPELRGRIFSRLFIVGLATTAISIRGTGEVLDHWPQAHHVLYPLGALSVVISALFYRRIRVRWERSMLREQAKQPVRLLAGLRLLKTDRVYGRFMLWQLLSGASVMMASSLSPLLLKEYFDVDYGRGTTSLVVVPLGVALMTVPLSGRLFDTIGITRFRAVNAALWATSRVILFFSFAFRCWPGVLAGFAMQGLGQSLGGMAYNIGHTRFSHPKDSHVYMGLHMTFQGIRGLIAPFLGMALYKTPDIGIYILPLCAATQYVAAVGFFFSPAPREPSPLEKRST